MKIKVPKSKTCKCCGKTFVYRNERQEYCSNACKLRFFKTVQLQKDDFKNLTEKECRSQRSGNRTVPKIKLVCEWCGKEFIGHTIVTRFCSRKCECASYKHRIKEQKIAKLISSQKINKETQEENIDSFFTPTQAAKLLGIDDVISTVSWVNTIK